MKILSTLLMTCLWGTSPLWAMDPPYLQYLIDTGQVYLAQVVNPADIPALPFINHDEEKGDCAMDTEIASNAGEDFSQEIKAQQTAKKILEKHGLIAEENLFPKNISPYFCIEKLNIKNTPYTLKHTISINKAFYDPSLIAGLEKDLRETKRTILYDLYRSEKVIGQIDLTLSDFFKETIEINVTFNPKLKPKHEVDFGVEMSPVLTALFDFIGDRAFENNERFYNKINFILMNTPIVEAELIQPALELLSPPRDTVLKGYYNHPSYNDLCIYFKHI